MRKIILTTFTLLFLNTVCAQFSGERTKNPYTAIDTHTYKVGDEITIGIPKKGKKYTWIYYYEYVSAVEQGLNVLSALTLSPVKTPKFEVADDVIKGFKTKILFFKTVEIENKKIMFAVVNYKDTYRLDIPIDNSLISKELVSLNPQYTTTSETKTEDTSNEMVVKSFDPNFNVKVLSIIGDKNEQTVKITFLISHKLAHQSITLFAKVGSIISDRIDAASLYDNDGNAYPSKTASIGINTSDYQVSDKIPTNIPVKASVTFKQVLPSVKEFNFMSLNVLFHPFDGWADTRGTLEITNLKVDWK